MKFSPCQAQVYHFVLVLSGFSSLDERIEDALFEAGCDDALLICRDNVPYLEFDRQATGIEEVVSSVIKDVESANIGAKVLGVLEEPEYLNVSKEKKLKLGVQIKHPPESLDALLSFQR
jgi:hypothetical protein